MRSDMKKLLSLVCLLVFVSLTALASDELRSYDKEDKWQYVQVGKYMYEKDGTEAPVIWRVLYVENHTALMVTEYVIDLCQPYPMDSKKDYDYYKEYKHKSKLPLLNTYEETEIPEWLDTVMWPVLIGDDPIGNAFLDGGSGRLFCMSTQEWSTPEYGFTKKKSDQPNPSRIAQVTPYVKDKKMYDWSSRMVTYEKGYTGSCYWTSTMRPGERRLQIVGINGHLSWGGWIRPNVGIRPSARLDLTNVSIASGTGTLTDPFVLVYTGEL